MQGQITAMLDPEGIIVNYRIAYTKEVLVTVPSIKSKREAGKLIGKKAVWTDNKGKKYQARSSGDGPVDACFKSVDRITKLKTKLLQYKLEAITSGKDAQGLVRVELGLGKKIVSGLSSSTDIIEASLKAYLDALNKLF